jgi:hypothetical protein
MFAPTAFAVLVSQACSNGSSTPGPQCQDSKPPDKRALACYTCLTSHCAAEGSAVDSECPNYAACVPACSCFDLSCLEVCEGMDQSNSSCAEAMSQLQACFASVAAAGSPCEPACGCDS